MEEELELLLRSLEKTRTTQKGGYTLHFGELQGKEVCIVQCGIGKVNAAALAQLLILEGAKQVIFTGVAGAVDPRLQVGDIVISRECLQHDVDVRALGYELGQVPGEALRWPADEGLIAAAERAAKTLGGVQVLCGCVLSGDQFIADGAKVAALQTTFAGSCVEMEGAAVAQVCSRAGVPFVVIRSISDSADGSAQVDFRSFTLRAAKQAKAVVLGMLADL